MNIEWALRELRQFVAMATLVEVDLAERLRGDPDAIIASVHVVEQILDRALPAWRLSIPEDRWHNWQQQREAAQRAIVQLERDTELRENLSDNAPHLDASQMHPWVWEGARSLWQSGHYREAVQAAARQVNAEVQNKLGRRDASEVALLQSAYSQDEPKPGQPRLRHLPDDDGGRTALSVRRGVVALAEGCYAALRNPSSHDVLDELPEVEALEQLAAFSLLARFVDRSVVVR